MPLLQKKNENFIPIRHGELVKKIDCRIYLVNHKSLGRKLIGKGYE